MKKAILFSTLLVFGACSPGNPDSEVRSEDTAGIEEVAEVNDSLPEQMIVEEEPKSIALECVDLGMDENEIPRSEVYLLIDKSREKVAECLVCQDIPKEDYTSYDIPSTALSACGGWWAGGGDYFYTIQTDDGYVEVYAGWQDEGQMEENDTSFHWELKGSFE